MASLCRLLQRNKVVFTNTGVVHNDPQADSIISRVHTSSGWNNNLCLAPFSFRHIRSNMLPDELCRRLRVGDVCVAFLPVMYNAPEYAVLVDLYNSNVANSGAMKARRLINSYAGTNEKQVSCMPIQTFVTEWNRSLERYKDATRCEDATLLSDSYRRRSKYICDNLADKAYRDIPVKSDNLWFVIHAIANQPKLVKEMVQLVGAVTSVHDDICLTGTVQGTTIERAADGRCNVRLYLVAKPAHKIPGYASILKEHDGVQLLLIWTSSEDELFDHLRNANGCYYVLLGTEYGNDFTCSNTCDWRYFNHGLYTNAHAYTNDTLSPAYRPIPSWE